MKMIGDHYKTRHTSGTDYNKAIFVFTHAAIVGGMPAQFNCTETQLIPGYCASIEIILKDQEEPKVIKTINSDYL